MQLSRFATNIKIDEDDYMLYSLKTRQYYPYKKEAQEQLENDHRAELWFLYSGGAVG